MADGEVIVVVEVQEIIDPEAYENYRSQAQQQFGRYGGTILGRGGFCFEGDPVHGPVLLQRWPSEQAFRQWQSSEEYKPLLELRRRAVKLRLIIVPIV